MLQSKYWPMEGGVGVGIIHPNDTKDLREILLRDYPSHISAAYFVGDPVWIGMDFVLTYDEESDYAARLLFNCPVLYVPKVLGRPYREGGIPIVQPDGSFTKLTPMELGES